MNERLLQFIWQFQYFNRNQLRTDEGETLEIISQGSLNHDQGPDFLNGTIRIGHTTWAGNIELHLRSSDWKRHGHTEDPNYRNVILHVVWDNDLPVAQFPTFTLKDRVPKHLLERYDYLMQGALKQACSGFLPALSQLAWVSWKERLLAERLERRATNIFALLQQSNQHWEEVLWWMLSFNFGMKVNGAAFEAMARSLPITVLAKHRNQVIQLEALILGQANLLNGSYQDRYAGMLQKEYRFLARKYSLRPHTVLPHFLRMRPANFPTVRLAQLAMLVKQSSQLFSQVREMKTTRELKAMLNVTANDYWHYHYVFDEETAFLPKHLGEQMAENIIINTIAPLLFAYGLYTRQEEVKDKAVHWLQQLRAEQNAITRLWTAAEVSNRSAFDSQSLIELTNQYCNHQRCLECAVGNKVLGAG
ncbi:MAG TPA: DUF2851 family protein [Chitinophagaceae bacterium]